MELFVYYYTLCVYGLAFTVSLLICASIPLHYEIRKPSLFFKYFWNSARMVEVFSQKDKTLFYICLFTVLFCFVPGGAGIVNVATYLDSGSFRQIDPEILTYSLYLSAGIFGLSFIACLYTYFRHLRINPMYVKARRYFFFFIFVMGVTLLPAYLCFFGARTAT
jgi:hypothetical protein